MAIIALYATKNHQASLYLVVKSEPDCKPKPSLRLLALLAGY